jgi:hypothetical protein
MPIEPRVHKDDNPMTIKTSHDKPKMYINTTQKEESNTNSRFKGPLNRYVKK